MPKNSPTEVTRLNLKAEDVDVLMQMRAMYMCQLLISLTSSTASNLSSLFPLFNQDEVLTQLAALDACFISFETMHAGWSTALSDLASHGSCDSKVVLQSIGAKPSNAGCKKILGDAVAKSGDDSNPKGADDSQPANDLFSWNSLLSFGCSPDVSSSELMLELQLNVQAHLLKHAGQTENSFRERLRLHIPQPPPDTSTSSRAKSSSTSLPFTLLWELEATDRTYKSPSSPDEYVHLPKDFELVFFGAVCHFV